MLIHTHDTSGNSCYFDVVLDSASTYIIRARVVGAGGTTTYFSSTPSGAYSPQPGVNVSSSAGSSVSGTFRFIVSADNVTNGYFFSATTGFYAVAPLSGGLNDVAEDTGGIWYTSGGGVGHLDIRCVPGIYVADTSLAPLQFQQPYGVIGEPVPADGYLDLPGNTAYTLWAGYIGGPPSAPTMFILTYGILRGSVPCYEESSPTPTTSAADTPRHFVTAATVRE